MLLLRSKLVSAEATTIIKKCWPQVLFVMSAVLCLRDFHLVMFENKGIVVISRWFSNSTGNLFEFHEGAKLQEEVCLNSIIQKNNMVAAQKIQHMRTFVTRRIIDYGIEQRFNLTAVEGKVLFLRSAQASTSCVVGNLA